MKALKIMKELNANAVIGRENDYACMVEDVRDPDGRWYRMEYRSNADGTRAAAYCRYNPWGGAVNGGASYHEGHVRFDGFICLGVGVTDDLKTSRFDLKTAVLRGRYWCTCFSVYKETGLFPNG